ncbi:hypothetical protein [Kribbella soli]|uniref:N-acetylglutamate synthase n=1 Tax=Kribbella soli TaxID=1124743 RepID=A0A4V6N3L4_9ACTN|nr:hypothetical protein [Kribbella soli]TCC07866.1 hypothetical protein E0H45_18160 [Kribbella soli]
MIDYDGRRFSPAGHHSESHDVTVASYRQRGDLLWADFSGGRVRRGALTGVCRPDDTLEFSYSMVLADGAVVAGHCESTPEFLPDGRIRLHERWERYGPQAATGVSELDEIASG